MSPLWYDELGFVYIDAKIPLVICPIKADAATCMRTNIDSFHTITSFDPWDLGNCECS